MNVNELEPKEVFEIFDAITKVPRPSKKEAQIGQWLMQFAANHSLEAEKDEIGNIVMRCPASKGKEQHEPVILQAHMDMVCEKNGDVQHDFLKDPIDTYVEDGYVKAHGTTLGGDDGIGIAMALAMMTSDTVSHPALECLFTVDEETGLTGAMHLKEGMLHGKRLINIDSEDDGQVFIGCAGGINTIAKMHYIPETITQDGWFAATIRVSGLKGGHSGDDINKGRGNANKILVRFLNTVMQQTTMHLSRLQGGNLHNAIAREAEATIVVPVAWKEELRIQCNLYAATMEAEMGDVETGLKISMESDDMPKTIIPDVQAKRLIQALVACPHGMMAMSKSLPGLVETSTNLASVKMSEDEQGHCIEICTSQRSSVESRKYAIQQMVACALSLACDEVSRSDGYPGWNPNPKSALLDVTVKAYEDLFNTKPQVLAIHAGLECGLFLEKYPYLDMVSVGPQMYGVHSPEERLSIESTQRCWAWLKRVVEML